LRCPHCRSRLRTFNSDGWQREQPDALVAGVLRRWRARFAAPVALVRVAFVVLSLAHALGVMAYLALWLLIPKRAGDPSLLERFLARSQDVVHRIRDRKESGRTIATSPPTSPALRAMARERAVRAFSANALNEAGASDEDLVGRIAQGEGGRSSCCSQRYERPLAAFLHRRTAGRDVEDLYQETWLRVVRAAATFDRTAPLLELALRDCREPLPRLVARARRRSQSDAVDHVPDARSTTNGWTTR
jgi:phage shock protein PspC (stress-responsive transcriptional regulator)